MSCLCAGIADVTDPGVNAHGDVESIRDDQRERAEGSGVGQEGRALPDDPLGRIEGGDGVVEGRAIADDDAWTSAFVRERHAPIDATFPPK